MRPVFFKIEPSLDSFFWLVFSGFGFFSSRLGVGDREWAGEALTIRDELSKAFTLVIGALLGRGVADTASPGRTRFGADCVPVVTFEEERLAFCGGGGDVKT